MKTLDYISYGYLRVRVNMCMRALGERGERVRRKYKLMRRKNGEYSGKSVHSQYVSSSFSLRIPSCAS